MPIDPTPEIAEKLIATDADKPVIFINCHKYFDRARYPEDYNNPDFPTDVSGQEAYHRYLWQVEERFMPQVGGRFLMAGPIDLVLIGDGDWDEIVIGEYPSTDEAFRMPTLPGYEDIAVHRLAGLKEAQTFALRQNKLERLAIPDAWMNRV